MVVLAVINEVPDFFSHARWFHVLNRHTISGLHLVGLLPRPRLLEVIRGVGVKGGRDSALMDRASRAWRRNKVGSGRAGAAPGGAFEGQSVATVPSGG